jgi:hypothetical protein
VLAFGTCGHARDQVGTSAMNRRRLLSSLGPLLAIACSGTTASTGPSGQQTKACIKADSSYRAIWTEQSGGACGPIGDTVFSTTADGSRKPGASVCNGTVVENGCSEVLTNYACPGSSAETQSGQMTWAADGLTATGTIDVSLSRSPRNGSPCTSTYSVRYERE